MENRVHAESVREQRSTLRGNIADQQLLAQLENVTKGSKPGVDGYETVQVEIAPWKSLVFARYIEQSYEAMEAAISHGGGEISFQLGEYARYCVTLVNARCQYVATGRGVIRPNDAIVVPAFLNLVLNQIGTCTNDELGLVFIPKFWSETPDLKSLTREETLLMSIFGLDDEDFDPTNFAFMTRDELGNMSLRLRLLRKFGFVMAEQPFDRSRDGDWEFMSLQILNNSVYAMNADAAPVHAMLASVLSLKQLQSVLLPRVNYGPMSFFASLVEAVSGPTSG